MTDAWRWKDRYAPEDLEAVSCPVCGADLASPIATEFLLKIVRCSGCGLIYVNPRPRDSEKNYWAPSRAEIEKKYAAIFEGRKPHDRDGLYASHLDTIARYQPNGRFLDIGAHCGFFLRRTKGRDWDAEGVEPSPVLGELAREKFGLNVRTGSLVEPISCTVRSTLRCLPKPGDRVLVIGAGIIGLSQIMAVRAFQPDCQITAMARYPHQAEMAKRLGANDVLAEREGYEGIARLTGGKFYSAPMNKGIVIGGFDVIYDCVGNGQTIEDSLRWTRAGGTVVIVGINLSPVHVDLTPTWYHHVNLIGTYGHGHSTWNGQTRHDYDRVIDFMRDGRFPTDGLITHRFPVKEYKRAIAASMSKAKEKPIKVVLEM